MYLIDLVVPREIHEFYISVFSFPISMDEIRTDRMVESVNLSQKWIGFEGKHNDNDDDDFGDLDTRVHINERSLMILHEYIWVYYRVSQAYMHWRQSFYCERERRRKKTKLTSADSSVLPFHRCCTVIRLLRALDFGTNFFAVAFALQCFCIHKIFEFRKTRVVRKWFFFFFFFRFAVFLVPLSSLWCHHNGQFVYFTSHKLCC